VLVSHDERRRGEVAGMLADLGWETAIASDYTEGILAVTAVEGPPQAVVLDVKRVAVGRGRAGKGEMLAAARLRWGPAVADDNRDRKAVYREVAVANGHPEWEAQIREVFARQWIESARPGWWYQAGAGWKQK